MKRTVEIKSVEGHPVLEFGWLFKVLAGGASLTLLGALTTMLITYPSLAKDGIERDDKIEELQSADKVTEHNMIVMDETARIMKAEVAWTGLKIDALLLKLGVIERIKRPEVEPTKLEHIK